MAHMVYTSWFSGFWVFYGPAHFAKHERQSSICLLSRALQGYPALKIPITLLKASLQVGRAVLVAQRRLDGSPDPAAGITAYLEESRVWGSGFRAYDGSIRLCGVCGPRAIFHTTRLPGQPCY